MDMQGKSGHSLITCSQCTVLISMFLKVCRFQDTAVDLSLCFPAYKLGGDCSDNIFALCTNIGSHILTSGMLL